NWSRVTASWSASPLMAAPVVCPVCLPPVSVHEDAPCKVLAPRWYPPVSPHSAMRDSAEEPMRYKLLGRNGLRVSELCLGTMTFGEDWGWGSSHQVSRQVFDAFAEAGGNFLDTADGYTNGTSERLVGEFVRPQRARWVVATKYSFNQRPGDPNAGGNHRKNMVQALEGSLKRLGTDYVDLYWVHAWDGLTPVEELMRGLDDMVRAGKVLYVGVSDAPAWQVSRANMLAQLRGWSPFVALQVEYSLV